MGLMKKLTSAIVASSLVLSAAGTVLAAPSADEQSASFARMEALKLVVGTDQGPELDGPLTRAQLLTIIVRAFQQETAANLLKDLGSFSDVPGGQWYSGYVAVAKNLATERGFAIGYPDGTFQPNKQVSVIEALAMIMKFLGVPTGTGDNWIAQTIENAKAYGVITDADVENYFADPNAPATRGVAFALADQIFSTYKVAGDKTVYTYYVDTQAPVVSVDSLAAPTTTEASVTIKGRIEGADKAYVNGNEIILGVDGSFSVAVDLQAGENNIVVSATDIAGNYAEQVVRVTRIAGAAAEIQVEATDITVAAGSEIELGYKVVDATGLELADATAAVTVTVEGEIGTVEGGVLTAAEKVGKGTITLSYEGLADVVLNVTIVPAELDAVKVETESAAPGEAVKLIPVDAYGNVIEAEDIEFSTDEKDAFVKGDIFTATKPGLYKVTATQGEISVTSEIAVYGDAEKLVIEVPSEMVRNGKTEYTVTVKVVDKNGAVVRDFDGDIRLTGDFDPGDLTVEAENGIATFEGITVDTSEVAFAAEAVEEDLDIAEIEVKTVKPVATSLKLSANTTYYGLGERAVPTTVTLYVIDQAGGEIEYDEDEPIVIRISGPATLNGVRSDEILYVAEDGEPLEITHRDGETEGDITITATSDELKDVSLTLKAIQVGNPRNLVVTKLNKFNNTEVPAGYALYRIGLTDRNGVPVLPSDDYEVTLTFDHDDVTVYWNNTGGVDPSDFGPGVTPDSSKYKVTGITFAGAGSAKNAKRYVYVLLEAHEGKAVSFTASSPRMTSAEVDVEFKAGDAYKLVFDDVVTLADGQSKTVEFQLTDKVGAPVKKVVDIQLTADDKLLMNNRRDSVKIKTNADGKATVTLKPDLMSKSPAKITVTVDVDQLPGREKKDGDFVDYIEVYRATNDARRLVIKPTDSDIKDGAALTQTQVEAATFVVEARSRAGSKPLDDHFDVPEVVVVRDNTTLTEGVDYTIAQQKDANSDDVPGVYEFKFLPNKAVVGKYTITFTDRKSAYQPSAEISFSVVVKGEGLSASDKAVSADSTAQITVTLVDTQNNPVNAYTDIPVKVRFSGDSTKFTVDSSATIKEGTSSVNITVKVSNTAQSGDKAYLTFEADGLKPVTITVTVQ